MDRYNAIIHPAMANECRPLKTFTTLGMIWAVSLLCSLPLFLGRTVVDGRAEIEQDKIMSFLKRKYSLLYLIAIVVVSAAPLVATRTIVRRVVGC